MENVGRQPGWGTVVAGVDESEHGRRALDYAATLAAGLDAEIIAVRAGTDAAPDEPTVEVGGRRIPIRRVEGHPVPALLAAAAEENARLLAVGRRGGGGFPGLIVGSTAHQVIRLSPHPILIVPAGAATVLPGPGAPIAVGLDGSPGSEAALRWTTAVAMVWGCEVIAVHALDLAPALVFGAGLAEPYHRARRVVEETVAGWAGPLEKAGVTHRVVVEESGAALGLIQVAHVHDAALLVVGSRGAGGFPGLRLGGVADQVVHYANLPVVVVPPDATDDHEPGQSS
jgi:nucleotide-binding universal stress UspA family protein